MLLILFILKRPRMKIKCLSVLWGTHIQTGLYASIVSFHSINCLNQRYFISFNTSSMSFWFISGFCLARDSPFVCEGVWRVARVYVIKICFYFCTFIRHHQHERTNIRRLRYMSVYFFFFVAYSLTFMVMMIRGTFQRCHHRCRRRPIRRCRRLRRCSHRVMSMRW